MEIEKDKRKLEREKIKLKMGIRREKEIIRKENNIRRNNHRKRGKKRITFKIKKQKRTMQISARNCFPS